MAALDSAFEAPGGVIVQEYGGYLAGTADPAATSVDAPIGTIYTRSNGEFWKKTGAAASAWSLLFSDIGNIPVERLNSGTGANSNSFWRGNGTWGTLVATVQSTSTSSSSVFTTTATIPNDNTIPQNTEGSLFLSATITPTSATNVLQVDALFSCSGSAANKQVVAALFDGGTNAVKATAVNISGKNSQIQVTLLHSEVAGTTSPITFTLRVGVTGGTLTVNGIAGVGQFGGVSNSILRVAELAQ